MAHIGAGDKAEMSSRISLMKLEAVQFFGDITSLPEDGRLLVPADVRKAVAWLNEKKVIKVIAVLQSIGSLDVYPADGLSAHLADLKRELAAGSSTPLEAIAALQDRYRHASYYPSDNRIHLEQAIGIHLRQGLRGDEKRFYIEARGDHIRLMTLEMRMERLAGFRDATKPPHE